MTISDACGAKHVNLQKMSYPACRSRHAIYRALSSVLSRAARSTNAWWRRAFYASVFPSRWAVTVLDWLISLSWRRSFIPSMLTSHSPCSPRCSGLRRWWLAAHQSSTNVGSLPPGEGVRTTARRCGDSWVISGRKQWISAATGWNGQGADLLTVVCRTDANVEPSRGISIIAVPRPDSGLIFEHAFDMLGHRAHLTPRFRLDAVQVPAGNLLGQEGGGLRLAAESFAGSGALVGIFGVALMRAAFQFALSFAKSEKRGGIQQIIQHQAVGYALADAKTTIEAARVLSWHACRALD